MAFLWFLKGRLFPDSLEVQARRFLDCEASSDAACLEGYMMSTEAGPYGMTIERLRKLLTDYVNPAFQSSSGKPSVETMPLHDQGEFMYSLRWQGDRNHPVLQRNVVLAVTHDGAKAPGLVKQLILDTMYSKYHRSEDENHYITYVRGVDHDAAALTQLGVTGLYDEDSGTVTPWPAVRDAWLQKLKSRGFNSPAPGDPPQ